VNDVVTFNPPDGHGTPLSVEVTSVPDLHQVTQPTNLEKWTANKTFTNVPQASTTGSGTGATATITVDALGNPTAIVTNLGGGTQVGDTLSFNPPDEVGTPIDVLVKPTLSFTPPKDFINWTPKQFWTTVPQSSTSGSGTG